MLSRAKNVAVFGCHTVNKDMFYVETDQFKNVKIVPSSKMAAFLHNDRYIRYKGIYSPFEQSRIGQRGTWTPL